MLCAILYFENLDKSRFDDINELVNNKYVLNKAEFQSTVTAVHILLLNYQCNYNSNRKPQYKGFINQLMFAHCGKTGDYDSEIKYDKQPPPKEILTTSPEIIAD